MNGPQKEIFSYATMAALFYNSSKFEPQHMRKLTGKLKKLKEAGLEHGVIFDRTAGGYKPQSSKT